MYESVALRDAIRITYPASPTSEHALHPEASAVRGALGAREGTYMLISPRWPYRSAMNPTRHVTMQASVYTGTVSRLAGVAVKPGSAGQVRSTAELWRRCTNQAVIVSADGSICREDVRAHLVDDARKEKRERIQRAIRSHIQQHCIFKPSA